MPRAIAKDGTRLHDEEAGSGTPLIFIHEFAGDHRSREPQMRYFSRCMRCVTYAARGFPLSDIPEDRALLEFFMLVDGGRRTPRDPRSSAAGIPGFPK